ncbi:MAG TPA: helix-turn-helix domain-containing protein [Propionibacteriaceae bacterium]|jgi:excisionase family DNA binding protein
MQPYSTADGGLTPIFVSVKQAAQMLGISPWSCYQLLDAGAVDSRYQGRRRLVRVTSLHEYAESLPSAPAASESA